MAALSRELGAEVEAFQTNHEGAMCERIHQAHADGADAVLINAGAWTHYSRGIRDALAVLVCPSLKSTFPTSMRGRHSGMCRCSPRS